MEDGVDRGAAAHAEWDKGYQAWREANPENATLLDRLVAQELPEGFAEAFPTWSADDGGRAPSCGAGSPSGREGTAP